MRNETIAVIGATGKTGVRVLTRLKALGHSVRGLSRSGEIVFDWQNRDTWKPSLEGVRSAYVTYYPDLAVPGAKDDIADFVDLAKTCGLRHLVLLSGRGEAGARGAEEVVQRSELDWNIVRASWFMQNFSESFMLGGLQEGALVLPEPKAKEPFIDVEDIADVAVAAITRSDLRNRVLEVTGPDLLSFEDCVGYIAKASGRSIEFLTAPVDVYVEGMKAQGQPEDIAWLINELFANVLDGRNECTTDVVQKVLGRPARRFQQYVDDIVQTGIWSDVAMAHSDKAS